MRSLRIHADDFGLSPGVVSGTVQSMNDGIVTGTSAMVCSPECRERVRLFARLVKPRVGLHLQLTDGTPLSETRKIPALVDDSGKFPRRREGLARLEAEQVLLEWRAQLEA